MTICLHTNFEVSKNYIGGTERFLIKLAKELILLGFNPFIVCTSRISEFEVEGIKVFGRIPKNFNKAYKSYPYFSSEFLKKEIIRGKYSLEALKRLSSYSMAQLEGVKADIFHFNSFTSAAFLKAKSNYIVTNHENEFEYSHYWGAGFFDFFSEKVRTKKTNLHGINYLITPSKYYATRFSKMLDIPIKNISQGIPLADFVLQDKKDARKKEFVILQSSRFVLKQKGIDIALRACKILKKKNIPFKMIFTGLKKSYEKNLPEFNRLARELDVSDRVKVSRYHNITTAYSECDIVISPERYCSFGLSICESLALGIPTVLSDIPTYREIASDYSHAIFFSANSHEDLANKIMDSIHNIDKTRNSSTIRFRSNFDLRRCAHDYSNLYQQASRK
ncbi:hypothetical protein FGF1_29740 [Flavobacteriaceae bacterium GF1]